MMPLNELIGRVLHIETSHTSRKTSIFFQTKILPEIK